MAAVPIAFRSNPGKYNFIGTTQLVNCYAEQMGNDAKAPLAVLGCEGLQFWGDSDSTGELAGPNRGLIYLEDIGKLYSVHPSSVYMFPDSGGSGETRIGTIPGSDNVQLSRNQKADPQIVVRSDTMLQVIESDTVSVITDPSLPSHPVTADFISKYHVYGLENARFYLSGINDAANVDGLDVDSFNQRAGKLIRVAENNGDLVGFCSSWTEFWRNTGNADFPFDPIGFRTRGCKSPEAVIRCDNALMFVGDDNNIYRLNGYDATIISTPEIARIIEREAEPENIVAFAFDRGGHKFACFTGADWTRCYDAATGVWHNRQSYGLDIWRARFAVSAFGTTILGSAVDGMLYQLEEGTHSEFLDGGGTSPIIWKVISPPLHVFPNGAIVDAVHFDFMTGNASGPTGGPAKLMLRTSVDGGNTFSNYRELELGTLGDYKARVTARRLGRFGPRGMVFELSVSDNAARALVGCDVQLRPLRR